MCGVGWIREILSFSICDATRLATKPQEKKPRESNLRCIQPIILWFSKIIDSNFLGNSFHLTRWQKRKKIKYSIKFFC